MKNTLIIILTYLLTVSPGMGQGKTYPALPGDLLLKNKEEVFIHYNSTYLLAGEILFYKFYSLDPDTGKPKDLSKVGYVELFGEDGNRVFLQKVALENGTGYGDFLIPSTVPSGTYKLTAYTRWMLNAGKDHFFKGDVVIINPYMEDQSKIIQAEDSGREESNLQQDLSANSGVSKNNLYSLETNSNFFGKREKVTIRINKLNAGTPQGDFSLSVKKMEEYKTPEAVSASTYKNLYQTRKWDTGSRLILPDLRGQVISGKVVATLDRIGAGGRSVAFSIPGSYFFLRIAKTAPDGSFLFNMDNRNFGSTAFLQVLGEDNENFDIILDEVPGIEKGNMEFNKFTVTPSMAELIRQRSIYNQVENSYAAVKQDTVLPEGIAIPFYGSLPEMYDLDQFTRFPTLQETFVEIIQMSRIRRNRDGTSRFELMSQGDQGTVPLLIVDGIIVQDHEDLVHYDARKIKRIGLQREEYYLGPEVFKGLIAVETVNGDFFSTLSRPYIKTRDIRNVQPQKEYFRPQYNSGNHSRVPDYRLQLLWEPKVKIENTSQEFEFFTSDVAGNYEINLEGFTENGDAVSLKHIIKVQ